MLPVIADLSDAIEGFQVPLTYAPPLSVCSVSAALFFGSLIPLAIDHQSSILMPTVYGIGTALPVVIFAILIALGAKWVGSAFNKISVFEKWARRITAVAFILIGIYYILIYIFIIDIID